MKLVWMTMVATVALSGCAALQAGDRADHVPAAGAAAASAKADQQMKMMQDMHQRMTAAKTPAERQALMAEHMKAMQGGMSMMCEMGRGMADRPGAGSSAEMMKRCMEMKDMTMQMMMDREGAKVPASRE